MSEVADKSDFPPLRLLLLIALWVGFLFWMVIDGTIQLGTVTEPTYGVRVSYAYTATLLCLDFWSFLAALLMGAVGYNIFGWLNGKRLIFGSMAFAVMLGRLGTGWLAAGAAYVSMPPEVALFVTPFVLLFGGIGVILAIALLLGVLFAFFVAVPVILFNQIFAFEIALAQYRYHARGLGGYIARAIYWLRNEPLPELPPDEANGARFATAAEIKALHNPAPESMAFGHRDGPLFIKTDKHVLVMASTRSGKGVALIIPHLLRYKGSAFVLDPKGENARASGRQRAALNGRVHYLDPFGISGKPQSRYNPLARFTPNNMEAESKALAAAIFMVNPRNRDHWSESGQQLLAALILYVYLAPSIKPADKDLVTVRRVLLSTLDVAFMEMIEIDAAGGLLRDLAISFKRTPEKEFGSIVSTAQRQTEILDNPFMQACLAGSGDAPEVDFAEWHRGTMTVYLCLAAPKFPTFNRWLRLVLTSALDTMTERLQPPPLPVCFMLDELATLGKLESVENAVGLSAGYGIQLVTVFQDVAQMRGLYEGRWASFVGNAGVRALFNLDDYDSAEYWSKFVGTRLVEAYGRKEDIYGLSAGRDVRTEMRPLLATDKLMMDFAAGRMLVLAQGARPIVTDRVPYYADPSLAGRWDDPRGPVQTGAPGAKVPLQPGPGVPPNGAGPKGSTPPGPGAPGPQPAPKPQPAAGRTEPPNFTMPGFKPSSRESAPKPRPNGRDGRDGR